MSWSRRFEVASSRGWLQGMPVILNQQPNAIYRNIEDTKALEKYTSLLALRVEGPGVTILRFRSSQQWWGVYKADMFWIQRKVTKDCYFFGCNVLEFSTTKSLDKRQNKPQHFHRPTYIPNIQIPTTITTLSTYCLPHDPLLTTLQNFLAVHCQILIVLHSFASIHNETINKLNKVWVDKQYTTEKVRNIFVEELVGTKEV